MTTDTTTNDWTTVAETISVCRADELPRERRAWWRPTVARSASFAARTASSTRSRIAAPTTTARWPRANSTPTACTVECPRHGSLFDLRSGRPKTLPAFQPVDTFDARVEDGEVEAGGLETLSMATPEITVPPLSPKELTEEERALKGIGSDYAERFGFHDPETDYAYKAPKGLSEQVVRNRSPSTRTSPSGCASSGSRRSTTSCSARPRRGAATSARSTSTTSTTSSAPRRRTAAAGTRSPTTSRTPSTGSASPRPSASSSPGSAPSTSPRSSITR